MIELEEIPTVITTDFVSSPEHIRVAAQRLVFLELIQEPSGVSCLVSAPDCALYPYGVPDMMPRRAHHAYKIAISRYIHSIQNRKRRQLSNSDTALELGLSSEEICAAYVLGTLICYNR